MVNLFDVWNKGNKYLPILDIEKEWSNSVLEWLMGENLVQAINRKGKGDINNLYAKHIENCFVANYREYNKKNMSRVIEAPDYTEINDIILSVPPQAIQITHDNQSIDIPILRHNGSIILNTGHGEVNVSMSIVFSDDLSTGIKLEDEIRYKLLPLIVQLKTIPFCHVYNEYIVQKICDTDVSEHIRNSMLNTVMLTYNSHSISMYPESPRILTAYFNFTLFNYLPYMTEPVFVDRYLRNSNGVIKRSADKKYLAIENNHLVAPCLTPADSLPFYELHAHGMADLENRLESFSHNGTDFGLSGNGKAEDELLKVSFNRYITIPTEYIDPSVYDRIEAAKNSSNKTQSSSTAFSAAVGSATVTRTGGTNSKAIAKKAKAWIESDENFAGMKLDPIFTEAASLYREDLGCQEFKQLLIGISMQESAYDSDVITYGSVNKKDGAPLNQNKYIISEDEKEAAGKNGVPKISDYRLAWENKKHLNGIMQIAYGASTKVGFMKLSKSDLFKSAGRNEDGSLIIFNEGSNEIKWAIETNIALGAKIYNDKFNAISNKNHKADILCALFAYNAGEGNFAKMINCTSNWKDASASTEKAITEITKDGNAYNYATVLAKMRANHSNFSDYGKERYQEATEYVNKVLDHISAYYDGKPVTVSGRTLTIANVDTSGETEAQKEQEKKRRTQEYKEAQEKQRIKEISKAIMEDSYKTSTSYDNSEGTGTPLFTSYTVPQTNISSGAPKLGQSPEDFSQTFNDFSKANKTEEEKRYIEERKEEVYALIQELIKTHGPDKIAIIHPADSPQYIYIRYEESYLIGSEGMAITSVALTNSVNIPRINLSGYETATHQYMGGHVQKLNMNIVVYDKNGDTQLQALTDIFNIVNKNARDFTSVACFDGVTIRNKFINGVAQGDIFTLDDIAIQTHPDIPGGSMVSINLTDITRSKENANRTLSWQQLPQYGGIEQFSSFENMAQKIFDWIFSHIPISFNIEPITHKETRSFSSTISFGVSQYRSKKQRYCSLLFYEDYVLQNYGEYMLVALNALSSCFSSISIDNIFNQYDKYDLRNKFINKNEIPDSVFKPIFKEGVRNELNANLSVWLDGYCINFRDGFNSNGLGAIDGLKTNFSDDLLTGYDEIKVPAYTDFHLPPSIDPNYYYYDLSSIESLSEKEVEHSKQGVAKANQKLDVGRKFFSPNNPEYCFPIDGTTLGEALYSRKTFDEKSTQNKKNKDEKKDNENTTEAEKDNKNSENQTGTNQDNNTTVVLTKTDDGILNGSRAASSVYVPLQPLAEEEALAARLDRITNGKVGFKAGIESNSNLFKVELLQPGTEEYKAKITSMVSEGQLFNAYADLSADKNLKFKVDNNGRMRLHTMKRAFPVYKVLIIEEDEIETFSPLRAKDFNDYFGLNAIQEIRITQLSDQPIDVAMVSFVDLSGRFTSMKFADKPYTEFKAKDKIGTEQENPLAGIVLREGTSIQIKAGYSNNINELDTVFNGEIVSVEGNSGEYQMICQSYGYELVIGKYGTEGPLDPTRFNAETKEILHWILSQPEVKHFGKWKIASVENLQFKKDIYGFSLSPYWVRERPDGKEELVWDMVADSNDMNILSPDESCSIGMEQFWNDVKDNPAAYLWDTVTLDTPWMLLFGGLMYTDFYVYNNTAWDVIRQMTYRYPGYIARPVPMGDRMTLFYGPPDAEYFHRPLSKLETNMFGANTIRSEIEDKYFDKTEDIVDDFINKATYRTSQFAGITFFNEQYGIEHTPKVRQYMEKQGYENFSNKYYLYYSYYKDQLFFNENHAFKPEADAARKKLKNAFFKMLLDKELRDALKNTIKIAYQKHKKEGWSSADVFGEQLSLIMKFENATGEIQNTTLNSNDKIKDIKKKSIRRFRNYWMASSTGNIIANNIEADYRDTYNNLAFSCFLYNDSTADNFRTREDTIHYTYAMNNFVDTEYMRTKQVHFENAYGSEAGFTHACQEFHLEAKKFYKGGITIMGEPGLKPTDMMMINDHHTRMYGPIEVMGHTLSITLNGGMTSVVNPGMVNFIKNFWGQASLDGLPYIGLTNEMRDWMDNAILDYAWIPETGLGVITAALGGSAWRTAASSTITRSSVAFLGGQAQKAFASQAMTKTASYVSGKLGNSLIGGAARWTYKKASELAINAAATTAIETGSTKVAGSFLTGPVAVVLWIITAVQIWDAIAKVVLATKYRDPIILNPLMKDGVPYMIGMYNYKVGGLHTWVKHEYKQFEKGYDAWIDIMSSAFSSISLTGD